MIHYLSHTLRANLLLLWLNLQAILSTQPKDISHHE